jgi:inosine-uridine nucleoside N-ribohydrolase
MWDPIAALALTHPELLELEPAYITSTLDELRVGRLFVDPSKYGPVRLVRSVQDFDGFIQALLAAWHHLGRNGREKRR